MSDTPDTDLTDLLTGPRSREPSAANELLPLVYDQLKRIAGERMRGERVGHTLQATALVNEAWLRMAGDEPVGWSSRAHFYAAAAEAMRRILIEHARARGRVKRGGGARKVPLSVVDLAAEADSEEILALDDAIGRLGNTDERAARIVRLRFYSGLSVDETAQALELSRRTVLREWAFARAWLYRELGYEDAPGSSDDDEPDSDPA